MNASPSFATWALVLWTPLFVAVLFGLGIAGIRLHWSRLKQSGIAAVAILVMVLLLFAALWVSNAL